MKILNAMVGTLLLAAAPIAAQAEDMSYSFIDLGYAETNLDGGPTGDGFGARGSVGFAENFFVFADYLTQDFGRHRHRRLFGRARRPLELAESVDLVGRVGYLKADGDGWRSLGVTTAATWSPPACVRGLPSSSSWKAT